jgi:hypothetical protein
MRTREQLLEDIQELPTFELTEAYTKRDGEFVEQKQKAVVEKEGVVAYAYVSPAYNLVQFKEIFQPVVENIQECEGKLHTYGGFARLVLFPKIGEFEDKWGIIAMNSVDKTSSIIVKFCVKHQGRTITLPKNIAGYVKTHTNRGAINVTTFIDVITKVKDQWRTIIEKFGQYHITEDNLMDVLGNVGIRDKGFIKDTKKAIEVATEYTLWELFMDMVDWISDKKYKSPIHQARKSDKICEAIINYSILLKI